MNLKEFKEVLNKIPSEYNEIQVSFFVKGREYSITDTNNIEWYEDDIRNNKKFVDITIY